MPARTSSRLHKNRLPVRPAPAPKRRRGGQSDNTKDLDPKDFDVYAIMAHQGKILRVLVSKARSYFFTTLRGWFLFVFLETNHTQFSHAPEKDTTEDNRTVWSLMNFLVLLWVGNFDYIWYKIIDHGGIGRYETRVIPDGHPREGEIYIIMKNERQERW